MNALGNNNKHIHLTKLAYSSGLVCLGLLFTLGVMGCSGIVQAAHLVAPAPGKDSASNLAVLSATLKPGEAVTCTTSTITQTLCSVKDTKNVADSPAAAVYKDSLTAYDALAPVPCTKVLTGTLADVTLAPGVYCFEGTATLTGKLTLEGPADGKWIFKIGTKGTGDLTGKDFTVVMAGGGQPCNVSWRVAKAANLTNSNFAGKILAGTAINITGGTCTGDTFAKAAVTLTDVNFTTCKTSDVSGANPKPACNQGVGNGPEGCDPGNSNQGDPSRSNDELGGTPGDPGRKGGNGK
jgi:hypothetical protein